MRAARPAFDGRRTGRSGLPREDARRASDGYKSRFPRVGRAVERLGRGARVRHNEELRRELMEMAEWLWRTTKRKVIGQPTSAPTRQICLRGGVCGVV
jgi:hypothetical protein